jgi:hypothetical protein
VRFDQFLIKSAQQVSTQSGNSHKDFFNLAVRSLRSLALTPGNDGAAVVTGLRDMGIERGKRR